jgi:hypothetical protein
MKKLDKETVLKIINMLEEEILAYDRMLESAESKNWEAKRRASGEAQRRAFLIFQSQLQIQLHSAENQTEQ